MRRLISKEAKMVEKSHTAGWFPSLYEPFRQIGEKVSEWFAPKSEASALEDCYEINMELPGVKIDDVSITMQNDALVVHGKKHFEHQETGQSFYFSEREYGAFQRAFRLPPDASRDAIDATFNDGVLKLRIEKRGAKVSEEKKIEIRRS
jgi:HSP20 family protein